MTSFVLATTNAHKADEIRAVLAPYGITLLDRPAHVGEVDETELTLEGNALLKARALVDATATPAIADDTGLFVDALDGRPGVFSARYAGESASFADNIAKVLAELTGVPDDERVASFRTVIAVAYPNGESFWVEGVLRGRILSHERGSGGFGYDPIFLPDEAGGRSLGELSASEKNELSHRGRALRAMAQRLGA